MSEVKYKTVSDLIYVEKVPSRYFGCPNPTITIRYKDLSEYELKELKTLIEQAILKFSNTRPLVREILQ